ncbi:MAG: hypothetical protein K2X69_06105 [Silvanigrellaceae bacterium]|nr:hypothetical protein [Silvanigrellaceae bacterium]
MKLEDFPALNLKPETKILIALDISSSVMCDIKFQKIYRYYLSQITEQIYNTNTKVKILAFDTEILKTRDYEYKNILDLVDFHYHVKKIYGGGTELDPVYKYNTESNFNADHIVIMTDGYLNVEDYKQHSDNTYFVIIGQENDYTFEHMKKLGLKYISAYIN